MVVGDRPWTRRHRTDDAAQRFYVRRVTTDRHLPSSTHGSGRRRTLIFRADALCRPEVHRCLPSRLPYLPHSVRALTHRPEDCSSSSDIPAEGKRRCCRVGRLLPLLLLLLLPLGLLRGVSGTVSLGTKLSAAVDVSRADSCDLSSSYALRPAVPTPMKQTTQARDAAHHTRPPVEMIPLHHLHLRRRSISLQDHLTTHKNNTDIPDNRDPLDPRAWRRCR